jgi:hypothetical protein
MSLTPCQSHQDRNENEALKRSLEFKEDELDCIMENRDQLLKSYTDMLNKENAETDRYMHEVESYQHFLLKNTPTPSKNQYEFQAMVCSEF